MVDRGAPDLAASAQGAAGLAAQQGGGHEYHHHPMTPEDIRRRLNTDDGPINEIPSDINTTGLLCVRQREKE